MAEWREQKFGNALSASAIWASSLLAMSGSTESVFCICLTLSCSKMHPAQFAEQGAEHMCRSKVSNAAKKDTDAGLDTGR